MHGANVPPPMTHKRIANTPIAEIEQILAEHRARKGGLLQEVPCRWCGDVFKQARTWQHFCSQKHQILWHQNEEKIYIEKLEGIVSALRRQIDELNKELIEARKEKPPVS